MANKNELKGVESAEKNKRLGEILVGVGIGLFVIGSIIVLIAFLTFTGSIFKLNPGESIGKLIFLLIGGILSTISVGLLVFGIVLLVSNNKKIKDYTNEKVIPKAKETLDKAEPVVTDVIKTVGEGIEDIAHNVKDTINKNKTNKKGK